jgi:hypothetical protein
MLPLLLDSLEGGGWRVVFCLWSYGPSITSRSSEVVSPSDWLVNSIWFFCSLGRLQLGPEITHCQCVCKVVWSVIVFTRQQLRCPTAAFSLVSSSPSKVQQFSFEYCPQSQETSSGVYYGHALGGWLATPPLFSDFVTCPTLVDSKFGPYSIPILWGRYSIPPPPSLTVLDCNSLFMLFSFIQGWGSSVCPGVALDMFPGVGKEVMYGACCSPVGSAGLCRQLW